MTDVASLPPSLARRLQVREPDFMVADGENLLWLAEQLCSPHRRIDPNRTMNDRFLRYSAAQTMLSQAAQITRLRTALSIIAAAPAEQAGRTNWHAIVWDHIAFAREALGLDECGDEA